MKRFFSVSAVLVTSLAPAAASCRCECVNGSQQQLCESSIDIPAICTPEICPLAMPRVAPIDTPSIPPLGTSVCHMEQVYNGSEYEYQRVCR